MSLTADQHQVNLVATDADGDSISLSATASGLAERVYALDQEKNFFQNGSYHVNLRGLGEKWIYSQAESQWYALFPDGRFYHWHSGNNFSTEATLVETLTINYFNDPSLLFDVVAPSAFSDANISISGTTLTITPANGFEGSFEVTVTEVMVLFLIVKHLLYETK